MSNARFIILSFCTFYISVLVSCGGGGEPSIFSMVPKGDYYAIEGARMWEMYNSGIFQNLSQDLTSVAEMFESAKEEVEKSGIEFEDYDLLMHFRSEDSDTDLTFLGGPFEPDKFREYREESMDGVKMDEESMDGRKYWVDEDKGAFSAVPEGLIIGHQDVIEDCLSVMAGKKQRLLDDEDFRAALSLVDLKSADFYIQWNEIEKVRDEWKDAFRDEGGDDDLIDACDDIAAFGTSRYWADDLKSTVKILFKNNEAAEILENTFKDDSAKAFDLLGGQIASPLIAYLYGFDAESLAENLVFKRNGPVLMIDFQVTWDELKQANEEIEGEAEEPAPEELVEPPVYEAAPLEEAEDEMEEADIFGEQETIPEEAPGPIEVTGDIQPPRFISSGSVPYPQRAKMLRVAGVVLIRITVLKDGSLADIRVLRESPPDFGFGDAAIQYLRQCEWMPAMKDGEAIDSYYNFSFRFTLSPDGQ